ncbi:MAG: hypothetical protein QOH06_3061 [Acidobacteriota bacterium]|jgi:hypothetical protein|nr:hypothetical protein [Acidobacteriota bacterium]
MSFGSGFLHNPDLFPARPAGEPWGDRDLVLDLPGGPYGFSGLSADQEETALARFSDLRVASEPEVTTTVFRAAAEDFREVDTRGWEYALDFDSGPSSVRLAGLDLAGRLDWRPALRGALWTSIGTGDRFPGIFENFCRVLVAYRLHEMGGAVIHGAAVVDGGEALLFAGRSGAGKSTVSRMALERGMTVLSDDLNALLPSEGDTAVLAGLPFTGDLDKADSRARYPLRALLRLEKDTEDRLRPLGRAETAACLLACSPFVNADPGRHAALLSTSLDLMEGVPAYALRFSLTGRMWSILSEE